MPQVKVWNDNDYPLKEIFKGDPIEIGPHQFKMMEFYEAYEFKGQYHPQPIDNDGKLLNDPKYFKKVRIERLDAGAVEEAKPTHVCMQCKHASPSPEELEAHMKFRHADVARLELPEVDQDVKTRKKAAHER